MRSLKNKINHFSKGNFQIETPDIVFPETNIVIKVGEGEQYKGEFRIENRLDGDIRGIVYPSSFRMHCREQGFQGKSVGIEYTYDGTGLKPDHVEHGVFTVVCNGGEYEINFTAIIEKPFIITAEGKVSNLDSFVKYAYLNTEEAFQMFQSDEFYELIKYEDIKTRNLYHNLRKWGVTIKSMEEFFVAIRKKDKLSLQIENANHRYKNLSENTDAAIQISCSTWGFVDVEVTADAKFLELGVQKFSTRDFQNSIMDLPYRIHVNELHGGKNWCKVVLDSGQDKHEIIIEVEQEMTVNEDIRQADYAMAHLLKSYMRYENGVVQANYWGDQAIKLVTELQMIQPNNQLYRLLQAQVYIICKQYNEARWILEKYNFNKNSLTRDVEMDCYYLYLSALEKRESMWTQQAVDEIQRCYLRNPKSWKLLCMLVQLDPYYKDLYEKKHALEKQFEMGANHLLLYMEAYKCFRDKSGSLKKIGEFEIQVFRFAIKYKLLTKELALYMANLAGQQRNFDERVLEILEKSYGVFHDPMILNAICIMLIKGNCTETKDFKWYQLAIQEEVKIARVFEYYMESLCVETFVEPLPRTVLLYFAHGNNLDSRRAALLYANVMNSENESSDLYMYYREEMYQFTMRQLEQRNINEHMTILYRRILNENEMNIEKIRAIYDILHSYQLTTKAENIHRVLVVASDGRIYQKVPYTQDGAVVVLDSRDDIILWETTQGQLLAGTIEYDTKRLFYELKFVDMCEKNSSRLQAHPVSGEEIMLTYQNLVEEGWEKFDDTTLFLLCLNQLREQEMRQDDYLVFLTFELFKREQYDKNTLTYLAKYFHGSTRNMKELWFAAMDYEVETLELEERIISQMVFSECVFGEEEIFESYYHGDGYHQLISAYLALLSHEYIVRDRIMPDSIMHLIMEEIMYDRIVADIVKVALLKYYTDTRYDEVHVAILKECLHEMCEKQLYFPFYMKYPEQWLKQVQLADKTLISYKSQQGGRVKLVYQLSVEGSEVVEFETETIAAMYEDIYVKKILMFQDEVLRYYFKETTDTETIKSKKRMCKVSKKIACDGKYGRLNDIINEVEQKEEKMYQYALEELLARKVFVPYE